MRVLRLCSVYEAPPEAFTRSTGFDAVGGMQVHTARLTEALDARGVAQTVITAYRPGAERVQLVSVRSRVIRAGLPIRRFRQLYGVAAVPEIARTGRVDLVHVHLGEDLAIVPLALWAASRARVPLVATVHCSLGHTLVGHDARSAVLRAVGGPVQASLLRSADAVLVLSDRIADKLMASGVSRSRVRVVPLGIELDTDLPHPRPGSMDGRRSIVYAGRLVREKGVRDLVAAFGTLTTADVGLVIVGDGPDRATLEAAARGLASGHRIRFVGAVPNTRVGAYLRHADLVVVPSWYEERGRVLLEAMAFGTPVVATRTGGIPATVQDGLTGLLVPPRDARRLAAAIDHVLGDDGLAASMAAAGRATASDHGIEALADATLAAYEAVRGRVAERRRADRRLVKTP
jgi:2-deoxystreptamine N-acetyl-D-glucosaminyltransferase/2-deoxystreptamine glucosyltransferase